MIRDTHAFFLDAPARAATRLAALPAPCLRACISYLAATVDGYFLHDAALVTLRDGRVCERLDIPAGNLAIHARDISDVLGPGDTMAIALYGLYSADSPEPGDWSVTFHRLAADTAPLPEDAQSRDALEVLRATPADRLKHLLSDLCEGTPNTIFTHGDPARIETGKILDDGTELTPAEECAMLYCSVLRDRVAAGGTVHRRVTTLQHGNRHPMTYDVSVTRHAPAV